VPQSDSEPEIEPEPQNYNNQEEPEPDDFWEQRFLSTLPNQTTNTTQHTHGSIMFDFLNTPQQNIIQQPPYTSPRYDYAPHGESTYIQNSMQHTSYHDPNEVGPSNASYPNYDNQTYNNQQNNNTMYNNTNYNHPPTPTNLLSQFISGDEFDFVNTPDLGIQYGQQSMSRLSLNSNDNHFLDVGWPSREHDVSLTLGQSSQMQATTNNNDEDQIEPEVVHRQWSRHQIIHEPRRNPDSNTPRPWCGTYHQL